MFSLDQYTAAHDTVAIVDRSAHGLISLTGRDRLSFLHALLTNDIVGLKEGTGAYAAYLTPHGRMISDMRVIETGVDVVLIVESTVVAALTARLDSLIFSEDVQVANITEGIKEFSVHGPSAAATIARVTGIDAARLSHQYDNLRAAAPHAIAVVRDDSLGVPGFDIHAPAGDAERLSAAFVAQGVSRASPETVEVMRIEAGRPLFGIDMNTDTIPLEAGIEDRAISFSKGCYVGQEVIIRVMHRGHGRVARRLVGLVVAGEQVPVHGDAILDGEKRVGEITSAAESPLMSGPVAMGYVLRDRSQIGTALTVHGSAARISALPFKNA